MRVRIVMAGLAAVTFVASAIAPLRATYQSFTGSTIDAAAMIRAAQPLDEPQGGKVLVPVVDSTSVSVLGALGGWLDPEEEVARIAAATPEQDGLGGSAMARAGDVAARLAATRLAAGVPASAQIEPMGYEGPSAGLAFLLELLDQQSPGDLTNGVDVAATGEVIADGMVLPVGGIGHKARAADHAGADLFIVPAANYAEAVAQLGSSAVRVVAVATVDDAIAAVRQL